MQRESLDLGVAGSSVTIPCHRQGRHSYHNGEKSQRSNQKSVTCAEFKHWLVDHAVPRREIGSLLNCYLVCISRKVVGEATQSNVNYTKSQDPSIHSQT